MEESGAEEVGQRKSFIKAGERLEAPTRWSSFLAANPSQDIVRSIAGIAGHGTIFCKSQFILKH